MLNRIGDRLTSHFKRVAGAFKVRGLCVLAALLLPLPALALQLDPVSCNTCASQLDFELYGESRVASYNSGEFYVTVMNFTTDVLFHVTIVKEIDMGHVDTSSYSDAATAAEATDFALMVADYEKAEHDVVIPDNTLGGESFGQWTPELLGPVMVTQSWYMRDLARISWGRLARAVFGRPHVAVVVFKNGDVAKYKVYVTPDENVAVEYIPGTARNNQGLAIPDAGFGGTTGGGSEGGDYVERNHNPEYIEIRVQSRTLRCGIVNDSRVDCYWV